MELLQSSESSLARVEAALARYARLSEVERQRAEQTRHEQALRQLNLALEAERQRGRKLREQEQQNAEESRRQAYRQYCEAIGALDSRKARIEQGLAGLNFWAMKRKRELEEELTALEAEKAAQKQKYEAVRAQTERDLAAFGRALDEDGARIQEEIKEEHRRHEAQMAAFSAAPAGFGRFPTEKGGEPRPIEWVVLEVQGDRALLISKYALDCRKYHEVKQAITWAASSLRDWLNGEFLNAAFSPWEREVILPADPENAPATDRVFLLSTEQAEHFFPTAEARRCVPTPYAKSRGAFVNSACTAEGKPTCWWWLRSPGAYPFAAVSVSNSGAVNRAGGSVSFANSAVRPALWLDLGE